MMQTKRKRQVTDVAREVLNLQLSDQFLKEISHSDVKNILNSVIKEQNYIWKFERSKKKGAAKWGHRVWDMNSSSKSGF